MKKIIIVLLTAVLAACYNRNDDGSYNAPVGKDAPWTGFVTIVIDSCEYISGGHRLAHKGNCKFCAERRKKEDGK